MFHEMISLQFDIFPIFVSGVDDCQVSCQAWSKGVQISVWELSVPWFLTTKLCQRASGMNTTFWINKDGKLFLVENFKKSLLISQVSYNTQIFDFDKFYNKDPKSCHYVTVINDLLKITVLDRSLLTYIDKWNKEMTLVYLSLSSVFSQRLVWTSN